VFQTCNEETCCIEFVRSNCSDGGWTAVSDTGSYLVNDCEPSVTTGESLTCDFNYCIDSEKLKKYFNDKYSIDQIVD
jgi:hypothetical protein